MNKQIARELLAIAKELTAGVKVKKTFHQDRDRYEEVHIEATISGVNHMPIGEFLVLIDKYSSLVVGERSKLIRKHSLKTDPLQPIRAEVRGGDVIIGGGFATDLGVLPREELKRSGFKEAG